MKKVCISCLCVFVLLSACATGKTGLVPESQPKSPVSGVKYPGLDEALAGVPGKLLASPWVRELENKNIVINPVNTTFSRLDEFLRRGLYNHLSMEGSFTPLESADQLETLDNERDLESSGLTNDEGAAGIGHFKNSEMVLQCFFYPDLIPCRLGLHVTNTRTRDRFDVEVYINPNDPDLLALMRREDTSARNPIMSDIYPILKDYEEYFMEGNYKDAIEKMRQTMAFEDFFNVFYWLGVAFFNNGDLDQAIENYTKSVEKFPDNDQALTNRGKTHEVMGEHDLAQKDFDEAERIRSGEKPQDGSRTKTKKTPWRMDYSQGVYMEFMAGSFVWGGEERFSGEMNVLDIYLSPWPYVSLGVGLYEFFNYDPFACDFFAIKAGVLFPVTRKIFFTGYGTLNWFSNGGEEYNNRWLVGDSDSLVGLTPGIRTGLSFFLFGSGYSLSVYYKGRWTGNGYSNSVGVGVGGFGFW